MRRCTIGRRRRCTVLPLGRTPARCRPSSTPGTSLVKRVTNAGTIRLKKRLLFLANALKQHPIGLEEVDDGIWSIHFCHVLLGRVDERDHIIKT